MEKQGRLTTFSFQRILQLSKISSGSMSIYEDKFILFPLVNSQEAEEGNQILIYPTRINDATFILLCHEMEGDASIICNMQEYTIRENTIFICTPGSILQFKKLPQNAKGWGIVTDSSFTTEMNLSIQTLLPHLTQLREQLSIRITPDKSLLLNDLLSITHRIIMEDPKDSCYSKKVKAQTSVFGYEIISIMSDLAESVKGMQKKPTREELYFKQFMSLLNKHYINERSVMFYADKMHLSPKYLSAVVKKVSGQTPSNWIDGLVIMEAKNLLKYSEMNIQEIAYQMNFPNQSFFGKYFKQRTGMTPSTYRDI